MSNIKSICEEQQMVQRELAKYKITSSCSFYPLSRERGSRWPWMSNLSIPHIFPASPTRHGGATWVLFGLGVSLGVLAMLKLLQCHHHLIHGWPVLCFHGQAPTCETGYFLGSCQWVLCSQSGIQDADDLSLACKMRLRPLHQFVLSGGAVLVDGTSASQYLEKNNSKAIDITLGSQMSFESLWCKSTSQYMSQASVLLRMYAHQTYHLHVMCRRLQSIKMREK